MKSIPRLICCVVVLAAAAVSNSHAQGVGAAPNRVDLKMADDAAIAYKLTPSYYRTSQQPDAYDVNLRANLSAHTAWIGYYRRASEFSQLRLGYEDTIPIPFGHLTPSLQYATRGFIGGSLNAEIGERWFALVGFGRTNLKDYFNLNFDPNDAVLLGFGTRALPKTVLSVFQIRDDRLRTGQRVVHVVARVKPDERTRWTFDAFHKEGRASADDEVTVRGTGISVTYDYDRYFIRVASDPHVNFTADHMVRVSVGLHF
jgi:hypothetical protein